MEVTIKDIASKAGVSVATVSRVLNKKPDVSEKTKKKIEKFIEEMGYNPSGVARGLVLQRTYTIGLIVPDITNPFYPEIARGIENRAKNLGYTVVLCDTDNNEQEEENIISLLKSKRVDGIILSSTNNEKELKKLADENFPMVTIEKKVMNSQIPVIGVDNELSAYNAVSYLIKLGHRKIGHITGNLKKNKIAKARLNGYKMALRENNIEVNNHWVKYGNYTVESGYMEMFNILNEKEVPTAVFTGNDLMAIGCYKVIYEKGLDIPADISLIGHDGLKISSMLAPGLTTMVQPKYKIGKLAVDLLTKKIDTKGKTYLQQEEDIILDTELKVYGSVANLILEG